MRTNKKKKQVKHMWNTNETQKKYMRNTSETQRKTQVKHKNTWETQRNTSETQMFGEQKTLFAKHFSEKKMQKLWKYFENKNYFTICMK